MTRAVVDHGAAIGTGGIERGDGGRGIAQVIAGYSILAASFILVFAVPLLTRGMWLIFRPV